MTVLVATAAVLVSLGAIRAAAASSPRCTAIELHAPGLPPDVDSGLREAAARVTDASGVPLVVVSTGAPSPGSVEVRLGRLPRQGNYQTAGWTEGGPDGTLVTIDNSLRRRAGFVRRDAWGGVFMHELGHVLGLRHSPDPRDLMFRYLDSSPAQWSANDLRRLRAAGSARGCAPASASG
jgi:hypothetical protein